MRVHLMPIIININIFFCGELYQKASKHKGKYPEIDWGTIERYEDTDLYDTSAWWYGELYDIHPYIINMLRTIYNLKFTMHSARTYSITNGFKGLSKILKFLRLQNYVIYYTSLFKKL